MYLKAIRNSLNNLIKNPVLFVPDILFILFSITLLFVIGLLSGIIPLLQPLIESPNIEEGLAIFIEEHFGRLIASLFSFIVVTFIIGTGLKSLKLSMVKQLLKKKKVNFKKAWQESSSYILPLIGIKIVYFTLFFLISIFLGFLLLFVFGEDSLVNISLILVLVGILFTLIFLFRHPILFLKEKNPIRVLSDSLFYFINNTKHVSIVFMIVAGLSLILVLLSSATGSLIDLVIKENTLDQIFLNGLSAFLKYLIAIAVGLYIDLLLFACYKSNSKRS